MQLFRIQTTVWTCVCWIQELYSRRQR